MDKRIKPTKLQFFDNRKKKLTAKEVREETGADYVINCVAFDMSDFEPVMGLRMNGVTVTLDDDYFGITWNTADDITMDRASAGKANYMVFINLLRNGVKDSLKYVGAEHRTTYKVRPVFGLYENGDIWIHADKKARQLTQFQDMAVERGVVHCMGLDGGGSTCLSSDEEELTTSRLIPIFLCIWEEKETEKGADEAMFKIALGAGHSIKTAGKRCLKSLDPKETREWWLNDRVCDYVESYLKDYEGYSLLRLDDSDDGATDVPLANRTSAANSWGADFYLSVHHNAGANGTSAGGIMAFVHPNSSTVAGAWRDALYDALIKHTGLKGNRSNPKAKADYYVLKHTAMPAVLLELGFMDSKTDVPVILTDAYAQGCARAIVEVIVQRGRLTKKAAPEPESDVLYRVQLGAFSNKSNAERLASELKAKGYQTYIVKA